MAYINGGVEGATTKKALVEALKADPSAVFFYSTSPMGAQFSGPVSGMPDGVVLAVCGPDPYTSRKWHANIIKGADGTPVLRKN